MLLNVYNMLSETVGQEAGGNLSRFPAGEWNRVMQPHGLERHWRYRNGVEKSVFRFCRAGGRPYRGLRFFRELLRRLALVPKHGVFAGFYHGFVGKVLSFCSVFPHLRHFCRGEHFYRQKMGIVFSISQIGYPSGTGYIPRSYFS